MGYCPPQLHTAVIKAYSRIKVAYSAIAQLGVMGLIRYSMAPKGKLLPVEIFSCSLLVRKGTPDLRVALTSLGGEFDVLLNYADPRSINFVVDAGGYIGTSAIALSKLFPNAKIIVVEPSTENLSVLLKNIAGFSNIFPVNGALVGSVKADVTLKNRKTGEWGFSTVDNPFDADDAEIIQIVDGFTLEGLTEGRVPDVLKLDIEGGEYELFSGDMTYISRVPIIFAELHERIVPGVTSRFMEFSEQRRVYRESGEKFLSFIRQ